MQVDAAPEENENVEEEVHHTVENTNLVQTHCYDIDILIS